MKRNSVLLPLMATLGASALVLGGCVATAEGFPESTSASQPNETMPPPAEIQDPTVRGTDASVAWEALMGPDGEYAAAAMYQAVIDEFGSVEPYVTIKAGEERHIDALTRQLERYGIDVPDNPYLGEVGAPADLQIAAEAWAEGEIANVEMYDELLDQTDDSTLRRVLENLRRASLESHLPLFELAAENGGQLAPEQMSTVRGAPGEDEREGQAMTGQKQGEGRGGAHHPGQPTPEQHSRGL
jgi:rubrerythrin